MEKIIKYGFLPIINDKIRGQNDIKGRKLFNSGHVLNVIELKGVNQHPIITCQVVAQTSVSNLYNVKIILNNNRNITSANCTCKAGLSERCKHVCAAVHYINSPESSASKTSYLKGWGKPSHRQQLGYDKGARMTSLFPPVPLCNKNSNIQPFDVSTNNLEKFVPSSPLYTMLKFEERNKVEILAAESLVEIVRMTEKKNLEENAKKITLEIFMLQFVNNLHGMECEIINPLNTFYEDKISCDINKALSISIGTINQSENLDWYQERKLRITASNGHKVKGNRFDVNNVITNFLNPGKIVTSAMCYGKKTEKQALEEYKKCIKSDWEVVKVGLIISIPQPWLSCSPDGILIFGANIWEKRLIEIKCPQTCRNKPVFDNKLFKSNLKYLKYDENGLHLSSTHSYYTQIQLQMYITNIAFCDFFVYSPCGSVLITIGRDDKFLKDVIPQLQKFYFTFYLPKLFSIYSTDLD